MAKLIRKEQIEGLEQALNQANNKRVTGIAFTGNTTKILTLTFNDGSVLTSTFNDLNTQYPELTQALLNTGTDTTLRSVSAKTIADYINARLSATMSYKGQKNTYAELPTYSNRVGDVWNIIQANANPRVNAGDNVAWNGSGWDVLSGTIDTSAFLTAETDPKGVASVQVTGDAAKTIRITLRDNTVISGTFTDKDTTYAAGTNALLEAGADTVNRVWSAKILKNFIDSIGITINRQVRTIVSSDIVSGSVNISLVASGFGPNKILVFLNGVMQPASAVTISGNILRLAQASLPTPIIVGDEVEIFALK